MYAAGYEHYPFHIGYHGAVDAFCNKYGVRPKFVQPYYNGDGELVRIAGPIPGGGEAVRGRGVDAIQVVLW